MILKPNSKIITLNAIAALVVMSSGAFMSAAAQSYGDSSSIDYDSLLKDYNKYQITKPVTQKEFDQALETRKSFVKKKKKKKGEPEENLKKEPPVIPPSPLALTAIPLDGYMGNTIIPSGFYLAEGIKKGDNYYIKINTGEIFTAELPAVLVDEVSVNKTESNINISDNNMIKIILKCKIGTLESRLSRIKGLSIEPE